jgi:antitoxin component YwqK of YwqJK toxin-antitoxin module
MDCNKIFKILTFAIVISILTGCLNEQNKENLVKDADSLWYYKGQVYSGKMYTLFNTHRKIDFLDYILFKPDKEFQREREIEVNNGMYHGKALGYYKTGELTIVGNYLNNRKVGLWSSFYKNGVKAYGVFFVSGKNYFDTSFDKFGNIWVVKERIDDNTIEEKIFLLGEVVNKGKYINGKKTGLHYEKEGNGDIWEGEYKDGLKQGKWSVQYANGKKSKINFANGKKVVPLNNGESPIRTCEWCGRTFYAKLKSQFGMEIDNYGHNVLKNIINSDPKMRDNPFAQLFNEKPSKYENQPYCTPQCQNQAKKSGYDGQRTDVLKSGEWVR